MKSHGYCTANGDKAIYTNKMASDDDNAILFRDLSETNGVKGPILQEALKAAAAGH